VFQNLIIRSICGENTCEGSYRYQNVVFDVLLAGQQFLSASAEVFGLIEHSKMEGLLCATTLTTIDYLLTQAMPRQTLKALLELFEIAPVNRAVLEEAFKSKLGGL